ncbi:HAMP domain-containing protein [Thalassomonas viridans]|uniref:histidine kinase n=1 Tax=Thalassomonas viridans TaxID=137584 RepID=A0AAF0CBQ2_9GAMM|nr:ATP-binding protein [Thalassomonas viridans]WDE07933.1 HAMP domain-containing protein [Thalassomonas viridans]
MTRLFISLYVGILVTMFIFLLVVDLIITSMFIDITNTIGAEQFDAEVQLLERLDSEISEDERKQLIQMIAEKNQLIIEEVSKADVPEMVLERLENHPVWFDDYQYNYFRAFTPVKYYRTSVDEENELIILSETIMYAVLFSFVFIFAGNSFLWLYGLHRKLRHLENAADKLSRGQLHERAPMKKRLRVGRLNQSFNEMAERIEQLLLGHKRLTHAVAHELRSPLFRLHLQMDTLEHAWPQDQQEHLRSIEEDIYQLDELVEEFLEYGKMERTELRLNAERINVPTFAKALCENLSIESDMNIALKLDISADTRLSADKLKLARALTNLLRNAFKYGHRQVTLSVYQADQQLVFSVEDDGKGIPGQYRQEIFQPYFRINNKEHERVSGYGLGLTICKEIAVMHSGQLIVEDSELGGAAFKLMLPNSGK